MVGDTVLRAVRVLETMPWTRWAGMAELTRAAGLDLPSASLTAPDPFPFHRNPRDFGVVPAKPSATARHSTTESPDTLPSLQAVSFLRADLVRFGPPLSRLACSRAPQAGGERPCALAARRPSASAPRPSVFSVPPEKTRLGRSRLERRLFRLLRKQELDLGAGATCFEGASRASEARKGEFQTMYLNRVSLIGFVGNDAELKSTKSETAVTVFSVATQRSGRTTVAATIPAPNGIAAWLGASSRSSRALSRSAHVQVEGELRYREYEKKIAVSERIGCRSRTVLPRSTSLPFASSTAPRSRKNRRPELLPELPPTNLALNL